MRARRGSAEFVVATPCVLRCEETAKCFFGGHGKSILSREISGSSQTCRVACGQIRGYHFSIGLAPRNTARSVLAGGICTKTLDVVTGEIGVEHSSANLGGPEQLNSTSPRRAPACQNIMQGLHCHDVTSWNHRYIAVVDATVSHVCTRPTPLKASFMPQGQCKHLKHV